MNLSLGCWTTKVSLEDFTGETKLGKWRSQKKAAIFAVEIKSRNNFSKSFSVCLYALLDLSNGRTGLPLAFMQKASLGWISNSKRYSVTWDVPSPRQIASDVVSPLQREEHRLALLTLYCSHLSGRLYHTLSIAEVETHHHDQDTQILLRFCREFADSMCSFDDDTASKVTCSQDPSATFPKKICCILTFRFLREVD